jgi:hypothetical protein
MVSMIRFVPVFGAAALALVASACKFPELPALDEVDAPTGDDGGGAADAATDGTLCEGDRYGFTISNVAACDIPTATTALDLSNVIEIDTFAGTMMSGGGSNAALPGTALAAWARCGFAPRPSTSRESRAHWCAPPAFSSAKTTGYHRGHA